MSLFFIVLKNKIAKQGWAYLPNNKFRVQYWDKKCKTADIFVSETGLSWIFCVKRAYEFCPQEQNSFDKSPPLSAKNPLSDISTQPTSDLTKSIMFTRISNLAN